MSSIKDLQKLTITPAVNGNPTAAFIFLHGLQGNSKKYDYIIEYLQSEENKAIYGHIDIIIPDAPLMNLDCTEEDILEPSWFNVPPFHKLKDHYAEKDPSKCKKSDYQGVKNTIKIIDEIIDIEVSKGVKPERIVLAGMSQGAAMTMAYISTGKHKLAGGLAIAGPLPAPYELKYDYVKTNVDTPLVLLQGTADDLINLDIAYFARDHLLKDVGFTKLEYIEFEGVGHYIVDEERAVMYDFLKKTIPKI